jgi:hypothetical protein
LLFSFFNKFKFIFNSLKLIININPTEYSKPANPNIKKVKEHSFKSSFIEPNKITITYKINQITSAKKKRFMKLLELIKKLKIDIQKINIQKYNQICISYII